jgi:Ala-tRNA(Pro) deacylase
MELYNGRPTDFDARLPKEQRCYDLLDSLGIDYRRVDHESAMTMEACAAVDQALGTVMCKNLLLCNRQCTDFYLLLMPGGKPFKTSVLSKQIGSSRLSFADGAYMEEYLDITPGSLSVLGLMNDKNMRVRLLIDGDVLTGESIGVHPCINTSSLRISTADLMEKLIPDMGHTPTMVTL